MDLRETSISEKENIQRHPWELARIKVISFFLKKHIPELLIAKNTSIADIGCGDIYLIHSIKDIFNDGKFTAVDTAFTENHIELLKKSYPNFNVNLLQSIDNLDNTITDKINIVFMFDVLEHIEHVDDFLKKLTSKKAINENTYFIITVPSYQSLFCRHDEFLGHYRRYNNKMLKDSLEQAGIRPVKMGYFFHSLLYPRILTKMVESLTKDSNKQKEGAGNWKGNKALTKLISNFLYCDFIISYYLQKIGIKLPGLSNYAICKKSV